MLARPLVPFRLPAKRSLSPCVAQTTLRRLTILPRLRPESAVWLPMREDILSPENLPGILSVLTYAVLFFGEIAVGRAHDPRMSMVGIESVKRISFQK